MVTAAAMTSRWFAERRALVMGLAGAGVSAGQLAFLPLAAHLEMAYGWRWCFAGMGWILLVLVLPLVPFLLRNDPAAIGLAPYGTRTDAGHRDPGVDLLKVTPLRLAARHREFWLLLGSFFVCGYTSNGLIGVHPIPHAVDLDFPKMAASGAMGLMGAMNVIGIGLWMLWTQWGMLRATSRSHEHAHPAGKHTQGDHSHDHGPDHSHEHHHHDQVTKFRMPEPVYHRLGWGPSHTHDIEAFTQKRPRLLSLLWLAIAGGLCRTRPPWPFCWRRSPAAG